MEAVESPGDYEQERTYLTDMVSKRKVSEWQNHEGVQWISQLQELRVKY